MKPQKHHFRDNSWDDFWIKVFSQMEEDLAKGIFRKVSIQGFTQISGTFNEDFLEGVRRTLEDG